VCIVEDICNGDLLPAAVEVVCAARSIGTDKGTGGDEVRPLAVPEVMYKLAGSFCLEAITSHMASFFPRIQYGCGIKGGPEQAVHCAQAALELGGADTVVLRTDFSNAFNERKRHIIARALAAAPLSSPLWRFFNMAYGTRGSHMGIYDKGRLIHVFMNTEGVKQGCPVAAFLFALSVQSLYEQCIAKHPDVHAFAVADDLTLVGPALSVLACLRTLQTLCAVDGPRLNLSKCEVLWAHDRAHPSHDPFTTAMRTLGVNVRYDCVKMLGSTIGLGVHRVQHTLTAVAKHRPFFDAIMHNDMPVQTAMLLLRVSGVARLTYLTRITPPSIIRAAAEQFDAMVLFAAVKKSRLPDPRRRPQVYTLLTTPLRIGGLGYRPHTLSSPAAYWASIAGAATTMRGKHTVAAIADVIRSTHTPTHHRHVCGAARCWCVANQEGTATTAAHRCGYRVLGDVLHD